MLDTFATYVSRDGGVVALAGNLVYLVDEDDTLLCRLHVIVGYLKQTGEDAFNILAHITGLGKYRGIHDGEGYSKQLGDGACKKCLARTCAAHDDDVALLNLHLIGLVLLHEALVVVVYRYGEVALGIILTDDVLVEERLYLLRFGKLVQIKVCILAVLLSATHCLTCNLVSLLGTLVADEPADTGDEHAHLGLRASAETAVLSLLFCHYFLISTWSIIPYSLAS